MRHLSSSSLRFCRCLLSSSAKPVGPALPHIRTLSTSLVTTIRDKQSGRSNNNSDSIRVFECNRKGTVTETIVTINDLVELRRETRLPVRDLRIFFETSGAAQDRLPTILSRPLSKCFLVNLEGIRLLCRKDSVIILNPQSAFVKNFVAELKNELRKKAETDESTENFLSVSSSANFSSMHSFLDAISDRREIKIEMAVLETALQMMTNRFQRHMALIRPMSELLLRETSSNPSAGMLRRVLAFRKTLNEFEMNVTSLKNALTDILNVPVDLEGLCLTETSKLDVEEMELLLEAYIMDLKEIEFEIKSLQEQIEDTNDFINIHLNSIRNNIIHLSLLMDMGTVSLGMGALWAGIFGMNLLTGLEDHPYAFAIVSGSITISIGGLFALFANRYSKLTKDSSDIRTVTELKHFFEYVKEFDYKLHASEKGQMDKNAFERILMSAVGNQMTQEDINKIFQTLDGNKDGVLDKEELNEKS